MKHNYNFPGGFEVSHRVDIFLKVLAIIAILLLTYKVNGQQLDANKLENVHYSKDASNTIVTNEMMVSGTVTDSADGTPLYGVNVFLKGTQTGTTTDENGGFAFPVMVNANDVLVFSFVGYHPKEYTITEADRNNSIKVGLQFGMILMGDAAEAGAYTGRKGIRTWWTKMKTGK